MCWSQTYKLDVGIALLDPAHAVKGHVWGSVVPRYSEGGLGHLRELQVLGGRDHICSQTTDRCVREEGCRCV